MILLAHLLYSLTVVPRRAQWSSHPGLRTVDVIIGVNRALASDRRSRELAAAVRDHLIDVHVELRAASRHPYMEGKHIVVAGRKDLVTRLKNESVTLVMESLARMVA